MIPHVMNHLRIKFPSTFPRNLISLTYNTQVPCDFSWYFAFLLWESFSLYLPQTEGQVQDILLYGLFNIVPPIYV